jgi:nucleoside-diphosphate-sugar epimerase
MIDENQPYPQQYLTHYPQTKAKAEQLVMKANGQGGEAQKKLKTTSLRPHLIIGQHDPHLIPRLVQRAQKGRLRQVGDGKNIVDMVHVKNAAMAHLNAYDAQLQGKSCGQAYFITNDEPTQLWPWVQGLLKELNIPFSQRPVSAKLAHHIGAALEWIYRGFNISAEPPMTRFIARQLACHHSYNIEKAKRDLNYQPSISMDEATQEIIQWMKTKL